MGNDPKLSTDSASVDALIRSWGLDPAAKISVPTATFVSMFLRLLALERLMIMVLAVDHPQTMSFPSGETVVLPKADLQKFVNGVDPHLILDDYRAKIAQWEFVSTADSDIDMAHEMLHRTVRGLSYRSDQTSNSLED